MTSARAVREYLEQQDMGMFEHWLKEGGDPNETDDQGRTLLMVAVARGSLAAVELLIKHKADCNRRQRHGATALSLASMTGSVEAVGALLSAGASVDITDSRGLSPIEYVQAKCAKSTNSEPGRGISQEQGRLHTVLTMLLQHKLRRGQAGQAGDESDNSAADTSAESGDASYSSDGISAEVFAAAQAGDCTVVGEYLAAGGSVDARDPTLGGTMLMCAASLGHVALLKQLLAARAEPSRTDHNGCTALHVAVFSASTLWAGVQRDSQRSVSGNSGSLHQLARGMTSSSAMEGSVLQLLLEAKAEVGAKDNMGLTPLIMAVQSDCRPIVRYLLRARATLDARDRRGLTALDHAESGGYRAIAKLLRHVSTSSSGASSSSSASAQVTPEQTLAAEQAADALLRAENARAEEVAQHATRKRERKARRRAARNAATGALGCIEEQPNMFSSESSTGMDSLGLDSLGLDSLGLDSLGVDSLSLGDSSLDITESSQEGTLSTGAQDGTLSSSGASSSHTSAPESMLSQAMSRMASTLARAASTQPTAAVPPEGSPSSGLPPPGLPGLPPPGLPPPGLPGLPPPGLPPPGLPPPGLPPPGLPGLPPPGLPPREAGPSHIPVPVAAPVESVPESLLCPIGITLMRDPVCTADGFTFERATIREWLESHSTSPLTGETLEHTMLLPNMLVRSMVRDFVEAHPDLPECIFWKEGAK
jgi:ankyrin repeat protein